MQEFLIQLLSDYAIFAPIIFIIIRSSSVIIPPIPGVVFDLVGIIAFGWLLGFIYAELGIMLGAMVAFCIARKFREPVIKRITSLQKVSEWENSIPEHKKFWALVAIRLPTNALFDYISYAAGLTKISPTKFLLASMLGNMPSVFLVYYFGGLFFQKGIYYLITFLLTLIILWLLLRKKITSFIKTKICLRERK